MNRLLPTLAALMLLAMPIAASADDPCCPPRYASAAQPSQPTHWMFQRSYYSHELAPEAWADPNLPSVRSAYRIPTTGNNPGIAFESRYRVNTFVLRNGRNSFDVQVRRSGGVEIRP